MQNVALRVLIAALLGLFVIGSLASSEALAGCYTRSVCKRYNRGQHCRRTRYCRQKQVCTYRHGKRVCSYRQSCYSGARICRSRPSVTRCHRVRICR